MLRNQRIAAWGQTREPGSSRLASRPICPAYLTWRYGCFAFQMSLDESAMDIVTDKKEPSPEVRFKYVYIPCDMSAPIEEVCLVLSLLSRGEEAVQEPGHPRADRLRRRLLTREQFYQREMVTDKDGVMSCLIDTFRPHFQVCFPKSNKRASNRCRGRPFDHHQPSPWRAMRRLTSMSANSMADARRLSRSPFPCSGRPTCAPPRCQNSAQRRQDPKSEGAVDV